MQIKPKAGSSSKQSRPERMGDYELLAELARDPFGLMSAARSISGQGAYDVVDVVALRSIQPSGWIDAWLVEDICQAAWGVKGQILSHVLPVTDVIVADGQVGVVTDYSEGEFLRSLLRLSGTRRIPFPVGVSLRIALDALSGLNSVQQAISRKPELAKLLSGGLTADRLMVGASGETELAEVVLSGRVAVKPVLAHDDDALGYRAPEHYLPEGEPDTRSDMFVIGICLWEMLANKALFVTSEPKGQAAKGLDGPTVQAVLKAPIQKLNAPSIPSALAEVVARALERDPGARFKTPAEFKDGLETAARSSIGTPADVARFVEQVAGQVLASRKALIHRALRLSDPGGQALSPPAGAIKVVNKPEEAPPSSNRAAKPAAQESPKPGAVKSAAPEQAPKPAPWKAARPAGSAPTRKATMIGMPAITPVIKQTGDDKGKADKPADGGAEVRADKPADDKATKDKSPAPDNVFESAGGDSPWGDSSTGTQDDQGEAGDAEVQRLGSMDLEMMEAADAIPPPVIKLADPDSAETATGHEPDREDALAEEPKAAAANQLAEVPAAAEASDDELGAPAKKSKTLWIAGLAGAAVLALIVVAVAMSSSDKDTRAEGAAATGSATASAPAVATQATTAAAAPSAAVADPATAEATAPPAASSAPPATPEPVVTTPPVKPVAEATPARTSKPASTAAPKKQPAKPPAKKYKPTGI